MSVDGLRERYQAYLDCLNRQAWAELGRYVDEAVEHNGRPLGLAGYQAMLEAIMPRFPICTSPRDCWWWRRPGWPRSWISTARRVASCSGWR